LNGKDKQDLDVILERMKQAEEDRQQMHTDIKFIKENLFNPHKGLWAESKQNTRFRENSTKWRGVLGTGFVALAIKHIWDFFVSSA
jgi:hypothetical protein